jgi:hypothetical protein
MPSYLAASRCVRHDNRISRREPPGQTAGRWRRDLWLTKKALPGIAWVAAGAARRITKRSSGESGSSNLARRSADPVVEGLRVYDGNTAARVAAT